jgi:menaquinol-cytochrome c reductase iron-sulfur subunit
MTTQISRSNFVKMVLAFTGSLIGAVIGLPAIGYLISPALRNKISESWIPLGPEQNYPIGKPKPFSFTRAQVNGWEKTVNSYGGFVIRKDENHVMVLSNICTHLGCRVSWHSDIQQYVCPCHDGHFDMLGNVISGPPPRPLDEFTTKVEDGILYIFYPPYKRS